MAPFSISPTDYLLLVSEQHILRFDKHTVERHVLNETDRQVFLFSQMYKVWHLRVIQIFDNDHVELDRVETAVQSVV